MPIIMPSRMLGILGYPYGNGVLYMPNVGGHRPPYTDYWQLTTDYCFLSAANSPCIRFHSRARLMVMRMVSLRKGLVIKS